jgi:hypothetical protein
MARMAAGVGSIDDMGLLRHGAMGVLFGGTRAASTLGSHLPDRSGVADGGAIVISNS